MDQFLFYLFGFLALAGGLLLVGFRNPVSSALSMVVSFIGLAGLFIGLNAYFVGIVQILVYAGAIMVLFIFIIMLLDLNNEKPFQFRSATILGGLAIPILFAIQILGVIQKGPTEHSEKFPPITEETLQQAADGFALKSDGELLPASEQTAIYRSLAHQDSPKLPDTNLIGETIFKHYNMPLQIMGVLLLVATVGVVVLSKRSSKNANTQN